MNLQGYREFKRNLYEQFASTVKDILSAAITNSVYTYHLQQIQHRAKTVESLRKKLEPRGSLDADKIEDEIIDLAGCRVIFYYNDDVNAFIRSGLVRDNFTVDRDKSNVHHPRAESSSANDFYTANHYVVELKDDRCALPE